jgi:NTP pyrophosphatase (non-canonical NTP hydrolase)
VGEPLFQHLNTEDEDASLVDDGFVEAGSSRAVAEYLGDMIGQLESMARLAGLDLLVYLLSMARVEAENSARTPVDESQRRLQRS